MNKTILFSLASTELLLLHCCCVVLCFADEVSTAASNNSPASQPFWLPWGDQNTDPSVLIHLLTSLRYFGYEERLRAPRSSSTRVPSLNFISLRRLRLKNAVELVRARFLTSFLLNLTPNLTCFFAWRSSSVTATGRLRWAEKPHRSAVNRQTCYLWVE